MTVCHFIFTVCLIVYAGSQAKKNRILWNSACLEPYIVRRSVLMCCQHGRDSHVARKRKASASAAQQVRVSLQCSLLVY